MQLKIEALWSPDLNHDEVPRDDDYRILAQVCLKRVDNGESQVYGFEVCGRSALALIESGTFVRDTLVLYPFSWRVLEERLLRLLRHLESSSTWSEVDRELAGLLRCQD